MKAGTRGGKTTKGLVKYNKFALEPRTKFRAGDSVYFLCGVCIDKCVDNITTKYLHVCTAMTCSRQTIMLFTVDE
eukprot:2074780-Ditylum_brightwellii.AAC.1